LTDILKLFSGVTSQWQPRQCRGPGGPKCGFELALMCYGIILSDRYSTAAGGIAPSACSFTQDVFPCIS